MFPSTTNKYKKERMENPGYAAKEAKQILNRKVLKESTNEALNIINKSFEQTYGISFEDSLLSNSLVGNGRNNSLRLCLLQLNVFWKIRKKLKRGQRNLKIILGIFLLTK